MNKDEIIFWLKHFAEHPTGFKGYEDGEWKREINLYSVFNYLLELKCKVNQLETNRDEAIKHIETHQFIFTSQYEEMSNFDNHLLEILRGKE